MKIPLTSVTSYSYTNSLFEITRIIGIFPSSSDASAHFHIETPSMYSARAHLCALMTRKSLACEQAPVGDSRVQSRANGMNRERSGEEGVCMGACGHSIDAAVP